MSEIKNSVVGNEVKKGMQTISINKYLGNVNDDSISLYIPVQRGDNQWVPSQKVFFIEAVLNNLPCPPIFTARLNGCEVVYDGLQRTTALKEYCDNKFAVNGKYYCDLSDEERKIFEEYELYINFAGDVTAEQLAQLFLNLNNGSTLGKTHKLKAKAGYVNSEWLNNMCNSELMTRLSDFTKMQKTNAADIECIVQGMILIDAFLSESNEESYNWKNISRDEQIRYCSEVLSYKSTEELKKYQEAIEYVSKISGKEKFKKTMIPAIIFLSRVAIMSGVTIDEFDAYNIDLENNKPAAYKSNMGSGNVSKSSTTGRIKALFDDLKQHYSEKVTMNIDFETKSKRVTKSNKVNSNEKAEPVVGVTPASTKVTDSTCEVVATEIVENIEVLDKADVVGNTDNCSENNVSASSDAVDEITSEPVTDNATEDTSSEPADTTVEGSASDSSEADAEHPSDGSDGTEEVA